MCGIAGISMAPGAPPPDPAILEKLRQALAHRGPDGSGSVIIGQTALVHTRLAIIDLPGGGQPFAAGPASLIANGEIYNFSELRAAMPDVAFATASDCEPPLHLFRAQGDGYTATLRGMYAIAIHDRAAGSLTLSRDPFGIKPLYYTRLDAGIAFASEPQALLRAGLAPRALRKQARDELLQTQFYAGQETIFPGIMRVLPGEVLRFVDGKPVDRRRIAALPDGGPEAMYEAAALARLDRALMESVELHQRSDVPYGMFLSGGIDSACVLATMARLNDRPVRAFTAGFDVPGAADERAQAARVARACGADHESIVVTKQAAWRHLPAIVASMDDPAADYAIIPTFLLARHARTCVKVVLSGEGGDEVFAGYGRYRSAMRPWFLGGRAMRGTGAFENLDVLRTPCRDWHDGVRAAAASVSGAGRSRLQAAQATDVADWLPHDLLQKLDRCLMANAVEGRTPFLDPAVIEAGFRLPDSLKIRNGQGKYLLRRWLETALPEARAFAPKQGFTVPVGAWIAEDGARLGELVAAQPGVAEIAVPDRVRALFREAGGKRESMAAWRLLFYALWHKAHIIADPCPGDVFEVLAEK